MSGNLFFGLDYDANSQEPINFLETRFCDLSPFSAHEIIIDGVTYKTAEHAYQALRVVPEARDKIMEASCPQGAWREGQICKQNGQILSGYAKYELMEKIFRAKLAQHADVRQVLVVTGSRPLVKIHDKDVYWGTGIDGTGLNKMGELWMKLRDEIITYST